MRYINLHRVITNLQRIPLSPENLGVSNPSGDKIRQFLTGYVVAKIDPIRDPWVSLGRNASRNKRYPDSVWPGKLVWRQE